MPRKDGSPTVSELFQQLGFGDPGNDIDENVRWALTELHLRRQQEKAEHYRCDQQIEGLKAIIEGMKAEWADKDDEYTEAVDKEFPTRSGNHERYRVALEMVNHRHGKYELVNLVNWLLAEKEKAEKERGEVAAECSRLLKTFDAHDARDAERSKEMENIISVNERIASERDTAKAELAKVIEVAHKHGWNGVSNSKILHVFLERELEEAKESAKAEREKRLQYDSDAMNLASDMEQQRDVALTRAQLAEEENKVLRKRLEDALTQAQMQAALQAQQDVYLAQGDAIKKKVLALASQFRADGEYWSGIPEHAAFQSAADRLLAVFGFTDKDRAAYDRMVLGQGGLRQEWGMPRGLMSFEEAQEALQKVGYEPDKARTTLGQVKAVERLLGQLEAEGHQLMALEGYAIQKSEELRQQLEPHKAEGYATIEDQVLDGKKTAYDDLLERFTQLREEAAKRELTDG